MFKNVHYEFTELNKKQDIRFIKKLIVVSLSSEKKIYEILLDMTYLEKDELKYFYQEFEKIFHKYKNDKFIVKKLKRIFRNLGWNKAEFNCDTNNQQNAP